MMARTMLGCCVAMLATFSAPISSSAQVKYPTRPVTLVVPYVAGSLTDVLARVLTDRLKDELGGTWIVETKPGASSSIGTAYVARAQPDGYTLLIAPGAAVALNELLTPNPPYRSSDLAPIAMLIAVPYILSVRGNLPVSNVSELAAYAKVRPGEVTLGNGGVNSFTHLLARLLEQELGVSFNNIPYSGAGGVRAGMLSGQIDAGIDVVMGAADFAREGKFRPIALLARERAPQLPELPTVLELGYRKLDRETWLGLLAPAGTPPEIIQLLNQTIGRILGNHDVAAKIANLGGQIRYNSPAEFAGIIRDESEMWKEFLAKNDVKPR